jgi:hypothetical protein
VPGPGSVPSRGCGSTSGLVPGGILSRRLRLERDADPVGTGVDLASFDVSDALPAPPTEPSIGTIRRVASASTIRRGSPNQTSLEVPLLARRYSVLLAASAVLVGGLAAWIVPTEPPRLRLLRPGADAESGRATADPAPGPRESASAAVPSGSQSLESDEQGALRERRNPAPSSATARDVDQRPSLGVSDVEAIERRLLAASQPEVVAENLRALERIATPAAVAALVRLASEASSTRSGALESLALVDSREAAPALVSILETKDDPAILAAAARALGRSRLRTPIPTLIATFTASYEVDARGEVVVACVEALGRIADPDAVPSLDRALASENARVRRAAIRSLGRIQSPTSIEALERFADRTDASFEGDLCRDALARLRGEPLSPFSTPFR